MMANKEEFSLVIKRGKLRAGGGTYATTFRPGKPVEMIIDTTGIPNEELCDFVGEALSSIRGAVVSRWLQ